MKKHILLLCLLITGLSFGQNYNVTELGNFPYDDMTVETRMSDVWGYADEDGNEYAIVGLINGTSVLDVTDPSNITEVVRIPGPTSIWRDIKTWEDHAYIVHDYITDGDYQGLLMIDLSSFDEDSVAWDVYTLNDSLIRAHNIYIDDNGVAYLFGSNYGVGGALMLDVTTPMQPEYLGNFNEYYLHDGYTRNDTLWGGAIYDGNMYAIDVSDKANPFIMGDVTTPNAFTHNCWPSDDNKYVFTSDEVTDGTFAVYDVSDLGNIQFMDKIKSSFSEPTIPHNTHVLGDFLVNSYYTDGLQIVNAKRKDNIIEVGRYDTSPDYQGDGYNGAWGAYPYLPSGNVLVSDRQAGLYVMQVDYIDAVYLEGNVTDATDQTNLADVKVELSFSTDWSDADGVYKTGTIDTGIFDITYSKFGYQVLEDTVHLQAGVTTIKDVELMPWPLTVSEDYLETIQITQNLGSGKVDILLPSALEETLIFTLYDIEGRLLMNNRIEAGDLEIGLNVENLSGMFILNVQNQKGTVRWSSKLAIL